MGLELGQRDLAVIEKLGQVPCLPRPWGGGSWGVQTGRHASWRAMEGKHEARRSLTWWPLLPPAGVVP